MQETKKYIKNIFFITIGAFLSALAIRIFIYPNFLIDGGIVGISLIMARIIGDKYLSYFLIILNFPFIYLAFKYIRKSFIIDMSLAVLFFALFLQILKNLSPFHGDALEVIVFGGALLGSGVGLMIKGGGCTDGTEILGIILNRKLSFTVGQVVLFINIFIFTIYGFIFKNWHIALKSLMTYVVAFKMIDVVLAGLEELKSVLIITSKPQYIKDIITKQLGLGLTIIPSKGGVSGKDLDILLVIVERLDLSTLKEIVLKEDPTAFMVIENLHEVAYGKHLRSIFLKRKKKLFFRN
ncbi:MAG: hypothetical protein AMS24_05425 [Chlamydiae bacterium SM23_39]|nr:MAG: hypothetical protein AMS24_05425 [Chlamydiae bacterium SM23_39]